jgi:hypothetical protein
MLLSGAQNLMPSNRISVAWHFTFELLVTGWRRITAEAL